MPEVWSALLQTTRMAGESVLWGRICRLPKTSWWSANRAGHSACSQRRVCPLGYYACRAVHNDAAPHAVSPEPRRVSPGFFEPVCRLPLTQKGPESSLTSPARRLFSSGSADSTQVAKEGVPRPATERERKESKPTSLPAAATEGGTFAAGALRRRSGRNPALRVCKDFLDAVGMTPLIYLRRPSQEAKCDIFAKCEFNNPGGSVKDRPAKYILHQAEREGTLGGSRQWIVEGSAGNTAIGLALASKPRRYRVVCVIPDTQTEDKKKMLKVCGALVVEVPFQKVWHPDHFVAFSGRLASVLNACWGNQFDNLANRQSHFETTGPEIWDQMDGRIDGFVSAAGTGGTVSGVSAYLRSQHPQIQIALADIPGSALYRYFTEGQLRAEGSSVVENIGQGRITAQLQGFRPDVAYEIPDVESLSWTHSLLEDEGLGVGMSSGVNVAAAVRLGKRLGPGHRIVTVLCDLGVRYAQKQWNVNFLKEEGLPCPRMLEDEKADRGAIMEAVHAAYAPRDVVERLEKEHENDSSPPGSKL